MTIKISGSAPKFEQKELEQRQAAYRTMYHATMESKEAVRAELPHLFLLNVIKHSEEGYILDENTPLRLEVLNYRAFMTKPSHLQTQDLEAADFKIKEAYIVELEAERLRYKQLLTEQLLEADAAKEQKKLDIARAKRLAEIVSEVENCFGQLVIPD